MMKIFFTFILILVSSVSYAEENTEHDWWLSTFGTEIPLESNLKSLDELVLIKPSCKPGTQKILGELSEYALKASVKKSKAARLISEQMKKDMIQASAVGCEEDELRTYTLGSYFISQRDLIHASTDWLSEDAVINGDSLSTETSLRNVLAAALLMKLGQVHFLTSRLRNELSGSWTSKEIFGAYDCDQTAIYIDPDSAPFDLGATFQHELDHLFRDKLFTKDQIQLNFTENGIMNWEAFLTLDESIASIGSAFMQRTQGLKKQLVWTVRPWIGHSYRESDHLYEADGDFNFRSSHGPMERIFQSGSDANPAVAMVQVEPAHLFDGIFQVVHSAYFGNAPGIEGILSFLNRQQTPLIIPLETASLSKAISYLAPIAMETVMKNHLGEAGVMVYDLYKTLSLLKPKLVSKSSACTFYENSIMKGEIVNYAGLKFSLQNPISQSLRTGEQGSRPGEQGSRPGEQGSRPGEQGSRPGLPVHPCMALHEQF